MPVPDRQKTGKLCPTRGDFTMDQHDWLINLRYWWLRRGPAPEGSRTPTGQYCPRFGEIAIELGFVSRTQVRRALLEQHDDARRGRPHRVLGAIFFAHNWMTPGQIDRVLNELFKRRQIQERTSPATTGCPLSPHPNP